MGAGLLLTAGGLTEREGAIVSVAETEPAEASFLSSRMKLLLLGFL